MSSLIAPRWQRSVAAPTRRNRPTASLREVCLIGSTRQDQATELTSGETIRHSGRPYVVAEAQHSGDHDPRRYVHLVTASTTPART